MYSINIRRIAVVLSRQSYFTRWRFNMGVILFIVVMIIIFGCATKPRRVAMLGVTQQDFSTLSGERDFWCKCLTKYYREDSDVKFHLFLDDFPKWLDAELTDIAQQTDNFVLIIMANYNSGIFEVIAIAKNK